MREIKFRVWDIDERKWLNDNCFYLFMGIDGILMRRKRKTHPACGCMSSVKIMQYTGLKDKNVAEVYESDLIKIGDRLFEVMFDSYSDTENIYNLNHLGWFVIAVVEDLDEDGERNEYTLIEALKEGVVVGNIHDNPELLEQSSQK